MMKLWKLERDANYYWGLFLMMLLPFALVWEFWKYSFCAPSHFPIYLLLYGWGYLLLTKSDFTQQITCLEEELKRISLQLPSQDSIIPESETSTDTLSLV